MKPIQGRSIWIIGASHGVGRALARRLAIDGNFVIVSARSADELTQLVMEFPGHIKALPLDVSSNFTPSAQHSLREITDYLDMVIYAAGLCEYEDNLSFDVARYERTFAVNFFGAIRCWKLALPLLRQAQGRPQFIAISSLSTCIGLPRAEAYGASKAALNYFMQSLRADLVQLPIDFSLIRPGFIATRLTDQNNFPMPLLMSPEQAAERIIKGIAKRQFFIDFPHRLRWALHISAVFFNSWCRWVAPKLTRIHHW